MEAFIYSLLGAAIIGLTGFTYKHPITGRIVSGCTAGIIFICFVSFMLYNKGQQSFYATAETAILATNIDSIIFEAPVTALDSVALRIKRGQIRDAFITQVRGVFIRVTKDYLTLFLNCLFFFFIFSGIFALSFLFQSLIDKKVEKVKSQEEQSAPQEGS